MVTVGCEEICNCIWQYQRTLPRMPERLCCYLVPFHSPLWQCVFQALQLCNNCFKSPWPALKDGAFVLSQRESSHSTGWLVSSPEPRSLMMSNKSCCISPPRPRWFTCRWHKLLRVTVLARYATVSNSLHLMELITMVRRMTCITWISRQLAFVNRQQTPKSRPGSSHAQRTVPLQKSSHDMIMTSLLIGKW